MSSEFSSRGTPHVPSATLCALVACFLLCAVSTNAIQQVDDPLLTVPEKHVDHAASTEVKNNVRFRAAEQPIKAVLTMDGGGLRGIIIVEVLSVIESAIKKAVHSNETLASQLERLDIDLADYFYAISGVNSAVWISTYLASKGGKGASSAVFNNRGIIEKYGVIRVGSVDGLRVLFLEFGPKIYKTPNAEALSPRLGFRLPIMRIPGFTYSSHPTFFLKDTLMKFLGETSMEDLDCVLLIPAYDLIRKAAVLFISGNFKERVPAPAHTYVLETTDIPRDPSVRVFHPTVRHYSNKGYRLRDLAHAGSVAATVHSAHRFTAVHDESFEFLCIDGGLMGNNPTLQSLIFLATNFGYISELAILSVGTGITGGSMLDRSESGAVQWMFTSSDFFTVITDGNSELIQAQIDLMFYFVMREAQGFRRGQYLRVQTSADEERQKGKALEQTDETADLKQLQRIGRDTADTFRVAIADFVETYIFGMNLQSHSFAADIDMDPTHGRAGPPPTHRRAQGE